MRLIRRLTHIVSVITAITLGALVLLVVYDATARYLFSHGSTALQELEWHLFDVVILLSIAFTLHQNAHVRVDILYDTFSPKVQSFINIISLLFFVLPLSLMIIYIGIDFVQMSFIQHEASSDPGGLPYRWVIKSFIPLSFALVALQASAEVLDEIKKWRSL